MKQKKLSDSYKQVLEKAKDHYEHNFMFNPDQMYCPYCGEPLYNTCQKQELLNMWEEMTCPKYVSPKDVFKCPNKTCKGHLYGRWIHDGGFYVEPKPDGVEDEDWYEHYSDNDHFQNTTYSAINSLMYRLDMENADEDDFIYFRWVEKLTKKLGFKHPFMPVIVVRYKCNNFGKRLFAKHRLRYFMLSETGDSHYVLPTVWSRLRYLISKARDDYRRYKKGLQRGDIEYCTGMSRILYGVEFGHVPEGCLNKFWYEKVIPFVFGKCLGVRCETAKTDY